MTIDTNSADDLEIDVDLAASAADEPEIIIEDAPKPAKAEITPDEGIEELKRNLEAARQAVADASRSQQEALRRAATAETEVQSTQLEMISTSIANLKRDNDILKANFRAAMSVGDYDKVADIQEAMSNNAARLLSLENGKLAMESRPKPQAPPQTINDPVERLASSLSPRSADWVRRHPEYAQNDRLFQKMVNADQAARLDDLVPDTDEYFAFVEQRLGMTTARNDDQGRRADPTPVQRRAAPASAPVSRSGTGDNSRPNVVRLTAEEREAAEMSGMTPLEYYKSKQALAREGKLH